MIPNEDGCVCGHTAWAHRPYKLSKWALYFEPDYCREICYCPLFEQLSTLTDAPRRELPVELL